MLVSNPALLQDCQQRLAVGPQFALYCAVTCGLLTTYTIPLLTESWL